MNKPVKLSLVIPAFNEVKNLKNNVLDQIDEFLKKQKYEYEVLIVDDGSTDETLKIAQMQSKNKQNFKVLANEHGGKAVAVMEGLLASKGEIVLFTDMDQATPIEEIDKFFPKFAQGADVVIGSRRGRKGAPLIRKLAAASFSLLRNLILGLSFSDTQCGFKAFNRKAIDMIVPSLLVQWQKIKHQGPAVNAGFDVELLFIAKKKNLKIVEVEVTWHHVGTERVQIIKDSLEAINDIFRIKMNDFQRIYH